MTEVSIARKCVVQDWVEDLSFMQQSVLLSAIRNSDTCAPDHPCKKVIKYYRRCILYVAFTHKISDNPHDKVGGSFTGPSIDYDEACNAYANSTSLYYHQNTEKRIKALLDSQLVLLFKTFVKRSEELPNHYLMHFIHAIEILGYKHPNEIIRSHWFGLYSDTVKELHLHVETEDELDARLNDFQ